DVIAAAVQRDYLLLLNRSASAIELRRGVRFLEQGGTLNQLEARILGSRAFFREQGGRTNAGFLAALFQHVLGRQPTSEDQITFTRAAVHGRFALTPQALHTVTE